MNSDLLAPAQQPSHLLTASTEQKDAEYAIGGSGIDFRAIWLIFRRNLWLVGGIVLVALTIGLVVTMLSTPKYVATATVQIDQQAAQVISGDQGVEPTQAIQDANRFLQTQIEIIRSGATTLRVAQSLNLFNQSDRFFGRMRISPPSPDPRIKRDEQIRRAVLLALTSNLHVAIPANSRLASIGFTSPDPQLAAQVANTYATEFIASDLKRKYDSTSYARDFLSQQLATAKGKLEKSERDLNDYARAAGLIATTPSSGTDNSSSDRNSVTSASLTQTNQAVNNAATARITAEEKWRSVQGIPLLTIPDVLANQAVQDLVKQRASVSAELDGELSRHRDSFPSVVQLKARLRELDAQVTGLANGVKQSIRQQYESARQTEAALQGELTGLKGAALGEQDRSVRYNILSREADTNRVLYNGLLQRFKEVSVVSGITASNVSVVDRADAPTRPASPNLPLNVALAALAGLVVAAAVVFIREQLDDAIRAPEDVESKLGLTVLGTVPLEDGENLLEDLQNPRSSIAEAYRSFQTALLYSTPNGLPKLIHVTSTEPGEGKSTTSFAIATGLAKLGRRTICVDIDLRRPALHKSFNAPSAPGLTDLLTTDMDVSAVLWSSPEFPNVQFIPSGPIPPSPTDLLATPRLVEILKQLQGLADVVVFDGPPVLGLADAPLLASLTGATIFVVEANRGHRGATKSALRRLQTRNSHIIGAVLTKFDPQKSAHSYGYGYGRNSYYQYGADDER